MSSKVIAIQYRLAAMQGDLEAQFILGSMHETGDGIPQNTLRAYVWFSIAAAQAINLDYLKARNAKDRISETLTPDQLARGQDMATRCFESDFQDCD